MPGAPRQIEDDQAEEIVKSRVLIIVRAHNEALNIGRVVDNLVANYPQYDYVVINDGSCDATADICRERGYNLVDYPVNLGLTGAFIGGMKYACYNNYEYVVQYDGDGQHNAEYIGGMIELAESRDYDIVIGSRFVAGRKPWTARMIGSRLIAGCLFITTGEKITDPTSGMRLYRKKVIQYFAKHLNYGPEPDTIAFLMRCGIRVKEYPVHMNERIAGDSYFTIMNGLQYTALVCSSILLAQWFRPRI